MVTGTSQRIQYCRGLPAVSEPSSHSSHRSPKTLRPSLAGHGVPHMTCVGPHISAILGWPLLPSLTLASEPSTLLLLMSSKLVLTLTETEEILEEASWEGRGMMRELSHDCAIWQLCWVDLVLPLALGKEMHQSLGCKLRSYDNERDLLWLAP